MKKISKKKPTSKKRAPSKPVVVEARPGNKRGKLNAAQRAKQREAMANNPWWSWRSRHGRHKLFETPQLMLEAALEYFKLCDNNPDWRSELVKYEGEAEQVNVDLRRPYMMQGLCRYLDCNTAYFRQFKAALRTKGQENWTQEDKDFSTVISLIEETIEEQQIAGALTGHFNGNIISRLLGLVDKKDVTSGDEPIAAPLIKVYNSGPPLAGSEDEIVP